MKHEMAMTKNVKRFLAGGRDVKNRPLGVEGMVLLGGEPGEGKSTAIAYATNMMNGIFLRAMRTWTVTSKLGALCVEQGLERMRFRSPMMEATVEKLMEHPRPIFIDEADYLMKGSDMLDILRGIYDLTGSPVVLIGIQEMACKVQRRGRFARRITQ